MCHNPQNQDRNLDDREHLRSRKGEKFDEILNYFFFVEVNGNSAWIIW
jgi:hypothetical protein